MDKTIKINLAGIVFQIEENAYHQLRDYLNAIDARIKNTPGGNETLDDIESRIAEIFQSHKGTAGVISIENVEAMIGIIGKPEDFEQSELVTEVPDYSSGRKRLYRNPDDSIISGVCGGIGAYLNFDPVWIRLLFILFTITFGIGFLVYIALWIALPNAYSDSQKKEMYGEHFNTRRSGNRNESKVITESPAVYSHGNPAVRNAGNALNEVFRAIGKFFYILVRIFLIVIGISFVLSGFSMLVVSIMTFFFNYPWFFFNESFKPDLFYLPGMLDFLMRPELTPWVILLSCLVVILPLLAFIYWGLKMIFWFRARDGVVSLVALVIWVMSICALSLIFFNQGISFAEKGDRVDKTIIEARHDTIYLKVDRKISSLRFDQEISIPNNEYSIYFSRQDKKLYGKPELEISYSDNKTVKVSVEKNSHGKTRREAVEKAESFIYSYRVSDDTILLDQYYEVPADHKWSGSYVKIDINLPAGTVIWIDSDAEILFRDYTLNGVDPWELGDKYWRWTENGPVKISAGESK